MAEIFHLEKSYDGALEIIQKFMNDPIAYWQKIGMAEAQIKLSLLNAQKLWQKFDRKTPEFLQDAIAHYLDTDKS